MSSETKPPSSSGSTVRVLSESEIQDRLYGGYLGRKNKVPAPPAVTVSPQEPEWTGSEILTGELNRLRSELITLRKEKEVLSAQLVQIQSPASQVLGSRPMLSYWLGGLLVTIILLSLPGYLLNYRILQASPSPGDPTPYAIQVAVYDVEPIAQRATEYLRNLGYDAFLVSLNRKGKQLRYRLYVGSFVTKNEARLEEERFRQDLRFQDFKDAFVRSR